MPDQWIVCPLCHRPMVTLLPMQPPLMLLCLQCGARLRIDENVTTEITVDRDEYLRQREANDEDGG